MKHILLLCTILLLSYPHQTHAQNGPTATAVPAEEITVDGNTSDDGDSDFWAGWAVGLALLNVFLFISESRSMKYLAYGLILGTACILIMNVENRSMLWWISRLAIGGVVSGTYSLVRQMVQTKKESIERLTQIQELSAKNLEQERKLREEAERELQTAHDMQMGLMPKDSPNIQGFDISGRCLPANHVGGDFFQYFPISDNRLAISLADVTGHAMEAAVPVMMFSGVLESEIKHGENLVDLFSSLNQTLHKTLDKRTFVCFAMGELDTETKKFRLSNGGCPYPYHFTAANGEVSELQVDAYPLGVRAETDYPAIETQLETGDRIVFCSAGIIEAENAGGEIFGFERTALKIKEACSQDLSAPQLLDYLINEVKTFTGDTPQGDDQTVVVLAVEE